MIHEQRTAAHVEHDQDEMHAVASREIAIFNPRTVLLPAAGYTMLDLPLPLYH